MKHFLLTFALLGFVLQLNAALVTWTGGGAAGVWNDAANWDLGIPGAGDDVVIGSNANVTLSVTTTVLSLEIQSGADIIIAMTGTLNLVGNTGAGGMNNGALDLSSPSGTVVNNGTINISNSSNEGIIIRGTFTNNNIITITGGNDGINANNGTSSSSTFNNNGTITITDVGDEGILVTDGSVFNNDGTVNISGGDFGVLLEVDVVNNAIFNNNAGANLNITSTGDDGIFVEPNTTLNNSGNIVITTAGTGPLSNSTGDHSLLLDGTFNNLAGGVYTSANSESDGIRVRGTGVLSNAAMGTLTLDTSGDEGIEVELGGIVNNSGLVDIISSVDHGLELFGTFNNLAGSTFQSKSAGDDGIRMQNTGVFTNSGAIIVDGSGSEDIETETAASFVGAGGTIDIGCGAIGDLEIRDDTNLGSSIPTFDISGTSCDKLLNTVTANSITIPTANLNFLVTPNVGECCTIVDGSGTVNGIPTVTSTGLPAGLTVDVTLENSNTEVQICIIVSPLPVSLTYFKGRMENEATVLNWETQSEENNDYFEVEHSSNGRDFYTLDKVEGYGNSTIVRNYEYIHNTPESGDNYYRLKQVDFDGRFEYSNIIFIQNEMNNTPVTIYPNPAQDVLFIEGASKMTFYDIHGRPVLQQTTEEAKASIDISNLEVGVYIIEISNDVNEKVIKRFIKN